MNDQFFNGTTTQGPQNGQQGAPFDYMDDGRNAIASRPGAYTQASNTPPYSPATSGMNQSSPPIQFKGTRKNPKSDLAPRKYTDALPPPMNMSGNYQGPVSGMYAPPAMGAPGKRPFPEPSTESFTAPPGFGLTPSAPDNAPPPPGFRLGPSAPNAAPPRQGPPPAQAPFSARGPQPYQSGPNAPQNPPWQNAPQSPPWQQNAPSQNPPWQNSPTQSPPWQNAPQQNGPQSPPWQNAPAQNGQRGYNMPYGPQSQYNSQRNMPPPPQAPAHYKNAKKKRGLPMWSRVLIGTLAVFLVLGGSAYAYYQAQFAKSINGITGQQVVHRDSKGNIITATPGSTDVLTGGRLNILLLGSDTDGKSAAPLAQTDIIVTIDPQTKYVGMLSIPRDLRLYAPSVGAVKLDEAFSYGWQMPGNDNYANAVGMSVDTIEQNFGIPINYSAWVGLDGFVKVIDTVGGIDVNILHPMVDDVYPNDVSNAKGQAYDYERLYIAPGPQHLNGINALQYVRTRHSDSQADFGRSARQQQILSQLKNKLTQVNVDQLPTLVQDLNGYVKTDMQVSDIPKLMNFARGIDPGKIDSLVLSAPYSVPAGSVLQGDTSTDYIPVCSQIEPKIQQMFALGDKVMCPTVGARYSFPATAMAPTPANQIASTQPAHTAAPALTDLAASVHPASTTAPAMTTSTAWQMLADDATSNKQAPTGLGQVNALSIPTIANPATTQVQSLLDLMLMTSSGSFGTAGA